MIIIARIDADIQGIGVTILRIDELILRIGLVSPGIDIIIL